MARFRGTVQGGRSEASRLGHSTSGLTVTANGWEAGIRVCCGIGDGGEDVFTVWVTPGSNGNGFETCVGRYSGQDVKRTVADKMLRIKSGRERPTI